ncbi:branched-chain amino acid transporter permease [Scrofimicrobium sp. R131]|uniref:AzlD domain-containing protein n=1 Tax=Scrofimicrobium appendicitidis TaxID=3079930 RepID=A0AAU7V4T5_9ACTO
MPPEQILVSVLVAGGLTWFLRAAPFAFIGRVRHHPLVQHLSRQMPLGVLLILVVYLLQGVRWETGLATAAALAVTVGLHLWRRSVLLSIVGGTAIYLLLL